MKRFTEENENISNIYYLLYECEIESKRNSSLTLKINLHEECKMSRFKFS